MCGICGEIASRQGQRANEALVRRMCRVMAHRGPDDEGYYFYENIGLGHRRLNIIDLNTGHQPIGNEDDSIWIIFNGEIYNYLDLKGPLLQSGHEFKTKTDTEVILHLYEDMGIDCVSKLRGQFAFAIWDTKKRRLFIARDRLGQKPLFYAQHAGSFLFASEVKALLQDPRIERKVNALAVHDFLSFKFIPRHEDLIEGIHEVPAASTLVYENGNIKIDRYWDLYYEPDDTMTEENAVGRTEEILRESVRMRLMSDVPLGAFLSSGLDSGLVVSMMSNESEVPINSFSIGDENKDFNELPHARMIAERHGTNHREFIVKPEAAKILPDLIWSMDGPYADIPALPMYYVAKLARKYVTVALTGDGGDESFAGYDRYMANSLLNVYRLIPRPIRSGLVPMFLKMFHERADRKSWRQSLRWMNSMSLFPGREQYARGISFFSFENEEKDQLYTPAFMQEVNKVNSLDGLLERYWSDHAREPLDRMSFTDIMVRMPKYSNIKVDRISMIHSLEARSPFMDHKLVEFAATIPPLIKIKRGKRKHILRKVAGPRLPAGILNLPKRGFATPINPWLRGELKGLAYGLLKNSQLVRDGFFNQLYINNLLDNHQSCMKNNGYKIWSLVNLETWYRIFFGGSDLEKSRENVREQFHSWE